VIAWDIPAAIRSPLARVLCTSSAREGPPSLEHWDSSLTSGFSRTAESRGSLPRFGSSSFVTSSDCSTSRSFASTGSTV
jgi:hypothetical protein